MGQSSAAAALAAFDVCVPELLHGKDQHCENHVTLPAKGSAKIRSTATRRMIDPIFPSPASLVLPVESSCQPRRLTCSATVAFGQQGCVCLKRSHLFDDI